MNLISRSKFSPGRTVGVITRLSMTSIGTPRSATMSPRAPAATTSAPPATTENAFTSISFTLEPLPQPLNGLPEGGHPGEGSDDGDHGPLPEKADRLGGPSQLDPLLDGGDVFIGQVLQESLRAFRKLVEPLAMDLRVRH